MPTLLPEKREDPSTNSLKRVIHKDFCLDMVQSRTNGAPNETRTFASLYY